MGRKSRYSTEFKQDAVSRMGQGGKTVTALAEELGVRRKFLYLWREQLQAGGKSAWSALRKTASLHSLIQDAGGWLRGA